MWLPTRSSYVPESPSTGYAVSDSGTSRFPSTGYTTDPRYTIPGYESSFEALNTSGVGPQLYGPDSVYELDFGRRRNDRSGFNPVSHYKRTRYVTAAKTRYHAVGYMNYDLPVVSVWESNFYHLDTSPVVVLASAYSSEDALALLWNGTDHGVYKDPQGLASFASLQMLPGIRPSSSLINSIIELKDLKTIPKTFARLELAISNFSRKFSRKDWSSRPLRQIVGGGADGYLQNKFNIAPMLQDITAISNSSDAVKGKLNKLLSQAGKPIRSHFRAKLRGFEDSDESFTSVGAIDAPNKFTCRRKVSYSVRDFCATMEYSYKLPDSSYEELFRAGLADHLGLRLSPHVIWNAIPWSFVVDWVVGVGPWLEQFTPTALQVVTHISKFGWSVHVAREIVQQIDQLGQVSKCTEESYFRTPDAPALVSSIRTSGLNSTEFTLAAALLAVRKG